jgi:hypothetical protein
MRGPTSSRNDVEAYVREREQCARNHKINRKKYDIPLTRVRGEQQDDDDNTAEGTISIIVGGSSRTCLGWLLVPIPRTVACLNAQFCFFSLSKTWESWRAPVPSFPPPPFPPLPLSRKVLVIQVRGYVENISLGLPRAML